MSTTSAALESRFERLRAELGRERSETLAVLVGSDLERFVVVSHSAVQRALDGRLVAPPLFLSSVMGWGAGPANNALGVDGTSAEVTRGLPLDGVRLMGAGQDLEFHEPVLEGMSIVVHTSLADARLKHGRSGTLLILQIMRRFTDDGDRPLVTCRETFIAR